MNALSIFSTSAPFNISPEFPRLSFETLRSQYKIHKLFVTIWSSNEHRRRTQSSNGFRKRTYEFAINPKLKPTVYFNGEVCRGCRNKI